MKWVVGFCYRLCSEPAPGRALGRRPGGCGDFGTTANRGRDRRCRRPPAQIPACASTHWAPPLGFGVEACVGPGVQDAGLG